MSAARRPPLALVVGQDRQETPLRYLVRGMRAGGWELSCLNPDEYLLRAPGIVGRVFQRATERMSWRALGDAVIAKAEAIRPDLVLAIKALPLSASQRTRLHALGAKLALWYPDVSFDHGAAIDAGLLDGVDLFATSKHFHLPFMAERFPDKACRLVEHGYCDDVHHPIEPRPATEFDVAYLGNYSPHKQSAIEALAQARPGLTLAVSGHGWQPDARWQTFPALVGEEMARFLSRARIALAVHYGPHGALGWEDSTSARTFEIPACGVFMLHPDNSEVRRYFEPESEIGVFTDFADMIAQADRWLADDAAREDAAQRACARARPAYAYSQRGRQLARWFAEQGVGGA